MKLYVPFYSRVYSILSKMKIKPWFEGNEKIASETTATSLIILHQYFFLFFVNGLTKKYLNFDFLNIYIFSYDVIYVILAILFLINFLSLQFFGKQVDRNKLKDHASIIIFSTSGIYFYVYILFF